MRVLFGILLASVVIASGGCKPDLGTKPFLCNRGTPECPEGYTCFREQAGDQGFCLKNGVTPSFDIGPRPDSPKPTEAGTPDRGPQPDKGPKPDGSQTPSLRLVVSEFMADPKAVTDSMGEYIELFNPGKASVDIHGWTMTDGGTDSHTINAPGGSLLVAPKAFVVLGRSGDKAKNGGINVTYVYDNFFLSNTSGDEIILRDANGLLVESFTYSTAKGFTVTEGAALSVKNPFGDKSSASAWCTETKLWTGSAGDFGTPGGSPGCQ